MHFDVYFVKTAKKHMFCKKLKKDDVERCSLVSDGQTKTGSSGFRSTLCVALKKLQLEMQP